MKKPHRPVAAGLYDWYQGLAVGQRKGRQLFYDQIAVPHQQLSADVAPISLDTRKQRAWLTRWPKQFRVSFRKGNKKYKLSAEERKKCLCIFWHDGIGIRRRLAPVNGNVPIHACNQTPLWEDCLEGLEAAVPTGAKKVAVKVTHQASRKKFTVLLSMTTQWFRKQ